MFMPKIATAFRPPYGLEYRYSGPFCLFCLLVASVTFFPFATRLAGGATYYLDAVNGSNSNDGLSSSTAWRTIGHALDTVSSGDAIIMAGGTYESVTRSNFSRFSDWVTFQAATGETPTIPYIQLDGNSARNLYLKFQGITIKPGKTTGDPQFYVYPQNGSYLQFVNCTFVGTPHYFNEYYKHGLFLYGTTNNVTIDNCLFTGQTSDPNGGTYNAIHYGGNNLTITDNEIRYHGTGIRGVQGNNVLVQNNHIHHCADNGIVVWTSNGAQILDNHIHHIEMPEEWEGEPGAPHNDGIQVNSDPNVDNLTVARNIIHDIGHQGLWMDPLGSSDTWLVENNLIYNIGSYQQCNITSVQGITFRNNTIIATLLSRANKGWDTIWTTLHNNIVRSFDFYGTQDANDVIVQAEDYNIWCTNSWRWTPSRPHDLQLASSDFPALFTDYNSDDYHLGVNSMAIDYCSNSATPGIDISGNGRVDIAGVGNDGSDYADAGCYEYIPSDSNNQAPVLDRVGNKSIEENTLLAFAVNATDADGDVITYSTVNLPSGATFSGRTFSWTPSYDQAGNYQVTFIASDGQAQDSETITITVNNPNRAPAFQSIGSKSVNENDTLNFSVSATDPDGDAITYSVESLPNGAVLAGQIFTWTPSYSQAGTYQVTFIASDGQAQDSETITITVDNVNRPPALSAIGDKSVYADDLLTFTANATDPDGDTIEYSAESLPSGATFSSQTFGWTPNDGQVGSYEVTFGASDGQLQDSETITIIVSRDASAPSVSNCSPAADAVQVPLNSLIILHITDSGKGVDANTVIIKVNGGTVYSGDTDHYSSQGGSCRRSGIKADYTFIYQSDQIFDYDQTVNVTVHATDLAGNVMDEHSYSFKTEMRSFSKNKWVSLDTDNLDCGGPMTACDSSGNIWVVWHAGPGGGRDIYISKLTAGAENFTSSVRLTDNATDQCNPAIAVGSDGKLYVVWQDNRRENWDIYISTSADGVNWSEKRITDSNDNETNPAIAIDGVDNAHVVWQDDRNGNQDIYIATSSNGFLTKGISQVTSNISDQFEPAIAVDSSNTIYIVWTDIRNGSGDIYGAASNHGPWTNVPIVSNANNQSSPSVATESAGSILHLLWVDDASGGKDIYYAASNGLPASPLIGSSIIDDSSGADQAEPVIAVTGSTGNDLRVFACWQDKRNVAGNSADIDLYFAEIRSGSGTNILVGDDSTNASQSEPMMGIDEYGHPYLLWTDGRNANAEIYYAGSTFVKPTALASQDVSASAGATVGTRLETISGVDDVSVVVPPGACYCDLRITISKINNPPTFAMPCLSSCDFGPSGMVFNQPVTITIPYVVSDSQGSATPYWYNSLSGALSQQGITDIHDIVISPTLHALSFKTTHFTPFYLLLGSAGAAAAGGGGGGCSLSVAGEGNFVEFLLPYIGLAVVMMVLKLRDVRNCQDAHPTGARIPSKKTVHQNSSCPQLSRNHL